MVGTLQTAPPEDPPDLRTEAAAASDPLLFPTSFAQRRLWFLDRMAPGNPFYNVSVAVRIVAAVDARVLRRALSALVERHESLRTTFALIDGEPTQVVGSDAAVDLEVVDLRHLLPAERERRTAEIVGRQAQQPFDLQRGPLMRCALITRGMLDHVLVLALHHIVCDGWSLGILGRELTALYRAFSLAQPNPLPELPIQYADFAVWQRDRLTGEMLERQLTFWREKLASAPALDLPTDRPRPPMLTFSGSLLPVRFSESLSARVRRTARQFGVTSYMILLAAFAALLHRYCGQDDIVIGAPVAGRSEPETEPLVGFFVNSVVLRIDAAGDPSFAALMARVRETALDAFTHQDLPFEKLVEELRPPRDPSRNPFFQVTFQLVNLPTVGHRMDADGQPPVEVQHRTAIFDLAFTLIDATPAFSGVIEYSTDLFDAETIAALERRFQLLLDAALTAPETALSRLPLADEGERAALRAVAAGPLLQSSSRSVLEAIERQAELAPEAAAIQSADGAELTYGELRMRWRRLAQLLRTRGIGPEDRIAVCMDRCVDAAVAPLAIFAAGGVHLPLDAEYPRERVRYMLEDAKARLVMTHRRHVRPGGALEGCSTPLLILDQDDGDMVAAELPLVPCHADNLAYVIYTSGSTGRPKGVAIPHRALTNHMQWMTEAFPLRDDDRVLQRTATSFDASVWEFLAPLMSGARLVLLSAEASRDPREIVRTISDAQVTVIQVVPALLRLLLDESGLRSCASLRRIFCGGEPLTEDLRARVAALGFELVNLYGPTETAIDATAFVCGAGPAPLGVPIGRPIANMRAYVLDRAMELTPLGLEGELYIGGPGVARGYLGRPALTAERFCPDPFAQAPGGRLYRTGDRVRLLADGNLLFVGRNDRQVKLRGNRVEPGEVEAVIREIAAVKDCAVLLDPTGEALAAFVVAKPHANLAAPTAPQAGGTDRGDAPESNLIAAVRSHLVARLPAYAIPLRLVVLDALPLSPNGKLDQAELLTHLTQHRERAAGYVAPRTALEEALALIWAETFGLDRVGVTEGFFSELGGHSLLATQLITRIRDALRVEVPLKQIFVAQTVENFAAAMLEEAATRGSALERAAELYLKLSRMSERELDLALAQFGSAES